MTELVQTQCRSQCRSPTCVEPSLPPSRSWQRCTSGSGAAAAASSTWARAPGLAVAQGTAHAGLHDRLCARASRHAFGTARPHGVGGRVLLYGGSCRVAGDSARRLTKGRTCLSDLCPATTCTAPPMVTLQYECALPAPPGRALTRPPARRSELWSRSFGFRWCKASMFLNCATSRHAHT
jgi:hypothetical protein